MPGDLELGVAAEDEAGADQAGRASAEAPRFKTLVALDQAAELRLVWEWNRAIEELVGSGNQVSMSQLTEAALPNAETEDVTRWWKQSLEHLRRARLDQARGSFEVED